MRFVNIFSRVDTAALVPIIVWPAVTSYGEFFNGAANSVCYPYLGCDAGFFGYDALEHFLFGFAAVWVIVWLCRKFPPHSILTAEHWKSGLILVASVMLVAVFWEIGEFLRDAYLLDIARERLFDLQLHINYLAQPSNFDTMGDLTLSFFGSLLALPLLYRRRFQNLNIPSAKPLPSVN